MAQTNSSEKENQAKHLGQQVAFPDASLDASPNASLIHGLTSASGAAGISPARSAPIISGLSANELFEKGLGISYDDFTILDTEFTDIDREKISLDTDLGNGIILKTPIIASPMDTVTSERLCIALALEGGIGCIHYNFKKADGTLDVDAQVRVIERVKRYRNGFIENPITVSPENTIQQAIEIGMNNKVGEKPVDTFPVTEDGAPHGKLLGMLRKQDYSRTAQTHLKIKDRMVPVNDLVVGNDPIALKQANQILWDHHLLSLPIVDKAGNLKYLVTRADLDKNEQFPLATKDSHERLRVLFAVETRPEIAHERMKRCFAAGADGCIIDTSQGYTGYAVSMIRYALEKYPNKLIIGGNITTTEAYSALREAGLKIYRNGQGSGSICTTAGAIGISRAGAAGIHACSMNHGMKTIADGGIRQVGDIFKALTIGADVVMLGNMLAGTLESPGQVKTDEVTGLPVKVYRGMGSEEANVGGIRGYSRLPQGVSGYVKFKGSIHDLVPLIRDGLLSAFHVVNASSIEDLHERMRSGRIRFERRTASSVNESKVHDLLRD